MSARRQRGEGSLFQRKDGLWIGRVELPSYDGKRRYKSVASKNFAEAGKKLRKLRSEIEQGRIPVSGNTTVEKWLTRWLEEIRGPEIGPSTYKHYDEAIRLHIVPHIGAKRLDRLTPEDVRRMRSAVQKTSTRAAQKAHGALSTALKDAMQEGLIARNVAESVPKPKHVVEERRPFTFDAAKHILATAVTSRDETWGSRWVAAFMTGARPAELRGLRWEFVDLDKAELDVSWQLRRLPRKHGCGEPVDGAYLCGKVKPGWCPKTEFKVPAGFEWQPCYRSMAFTRPKTQAGKRIVPVRPMLLAVLRYLRSIDTNNPHGLVWHHPDGRPFTQEEEDDAWLELMRSAGLAVELDGKWSAPTQYTARHTTSTLLLDFNVDEDTRMKISGHSSAAAQRMYAHVDTVRTRAALAHLDDLLPIGVDSVASLAQLLPGS